MKVSIVIVGVGQWVKYTKRLINSIVEHEPDVEIVVIDNGDQYPREYRTASIISVKPVVSYAEAINIGLNFTTDSDWVIIINNDTLCLKPFVSIVEKLNPKVLYGNKLHLDFKLFHHKHISPFVDGWIITFSRGLIDGVGQFDPNFKIACAEDADYCFRAGKTGYRIEKSNLPFEHLKAKTRRGFDNFQQQRLDNIAYLVEKHDLEWKK